MIFLYWPFDGLTKFGVLALGEVLVGVTSGEGEEVRADSTCGDGDRLIFCSTPKGGVIGGVIKGEEGGEIGGVGVGIEILGGGVNLVAGGGVLREMG